jgi:hypothetical protein
MNEIKKMQTPWDSDKILMVDVGCYERGCVCVANQWDADYPSECVPMVEYKEWVGLTKEEVKNEVEFFFRHSYVQDIDRLFLFVQTVEAKLKEKNGY